MQNLELEGGVHMQLARINHRDFDGLRLGWRDSGRKKGISIGFCRLFDLGNVESRVKPSFFCYFLD